MASSHEFFDPMTLAARDQHNRNNLMGHHRDQSPKRTVQNPPQGGQVGQQPQMIPKGAVVMKGGAQPGPGVAAMPQGKPMKGQKGGKKI